MSGILGLAPVLLASIGYFLGSVLGLSFPFPSTQISAIWPPNAILLAVFLVVPRHRWWIYGLAVLPVHLLVQMGWGFPPEVVLINFVGNVGDALIGALAVRHFTQEPIRLDRLRTVGLIMLCGGLLAPALVSLGVGGLLGAINPGTDPWLAWRLRLLTNTLAVFTLVPPIVLAATRDRTRRPVLSARRAAEAAALLAGLLIVGTLIFVLPKVGQGQPSLLYVPLPLLLWATVRFRLPGVSLSVLLLGALSMWGAIRGYGPFAADLPIENATSMILFLNVMCAPLLLLAGLLQENERTEGERVRVELESQEQRRELAHLTRVALLSELSGTLAHELNQPLTAILSNAQAAQRLLAQEPLDLQEIREALQDIADEDRRAGAVIQRLRAMLKKDSKELQSLDLGELVEETLTLVHGDLITRNVSVTSRLEPGLPAVWGDRVQLQQVLLNLILNACEAMGANSETDRRLTLTTLRHAHGVELWVSDRGTGLAGGALTRAFEPFFTTKENGLGLGLAISRSIVGEHGGRLWASNNEDRGATFHLLLPARA